MATTVGEYPGKPGVSEVDVAEAFSTGRVSRSRWLREKMDSSVSVWPIVFFRIFFGLMMAYHMASMAKDQWIHFFYILPDFYFTYPGWEWVKPWPGAGMYYHFLIMGIAGVGISLGLCYRLCSLTFFLGYTHLFLLEKSLYQNHCYLICLLSGIMFVIPAHRAFSIDNYLWRRRSVDQLPYWCLALIRFQIGIPYFYGGLAKLNYDWLNAQPMKLWLERRTDVPLLGELLGQAWAPWFFSYVGTVFDLLVVPALFYKPTRYLAYGASLVFHLMNSVLWEIGIFPWFMIGATLLFFPPESFRLPRFRGNSGVSAGETTGRQNATPRWLFALLGLYLFWQLVFPFRHFLYPGDVSWTEEGHHFAWHMMLREKDVGIRFYAVDKGSQQRGLIKVEDFLNTRQLSRMGKDPDMVLEFVHHVRDHYRTYAGVELEIYVLNIASLNGRKPQLLMDPRVDYAQVERTWLPQPWIVPLHEPLRAEGWNVPLDEWERVLELDLPSFMRVLPKNEKT